MQSWRLLSFACGWQAEEPRTQQDSVFDIISSMMARAGTASASEDPSQQVVLEPTEEESARLAALLENDAGEASSQAQSLCHVQSFRF